MAITHLEAPTKDDAKTLPGGKYTAIDTGDGFFTVKDVPIVSEIRKGIKGAPEHIGQAKLQSFVDKAQLRYREGNYLAPLHVGHHQVFETTHPSFAGFALPQRVAKYNFGEGRSLWTIYADLKITRGQFEAVQAGKLPYISAEIPWKHGKISSVSLLDSQPPHFEYALFTIGTVLDNAAAAFKAEVDMSAEVDPKDAPKDDDRIAKLEAGFTELKDLVGKFMDEKAEKEEPAKAKCMDECKDGKHAEGCAKAKAKAKAKLSDDKAKPAGEPVEQKEAKMQDVNLPEDIIKLRADLAVQRDENAKLAARLDARDADEAAAALAADVYEGELKGYQVSDAMCKEIAEFAKQGKDRLGQFVAAIKPSLQKDTPSTLEDAEEGHTTVSPTDEAVAQFQQGGPDALATAMKFAAEFDEMKAAGVTKGMTTTREDYVKTQMSLATKA